MSLALVPDVGDDFTVALDKNYNPIIKKITDVVYWGVYRSPENNQVMVYCITTDDGNKHLWPNMTYHPKGTIPIPAKYKPEDTREVAITKALEKLVRESNIDTFTIKQLTDIINRK